MAETGSLCCGFCVPGRASKFEKFYHSVLRVLVQSLYVKIKCPSLNLEEKFEAFNFLEEVLESP